mmetsp:Transcript_6692/g.15423  ORF Transcript_6692/g.15423 Transcript_6692/m.15423 type:complete len:512 (-) Transcript_6692:106-1641(-)|eukprot:CAMPEP_0114554464 /NCGR_PEP_ID=MMETSP0114-20121206/8225_1 /TAXON_ID=31324 /ORGANISM="Goniomonas sp, Strain m" /LENGTH=511 /DNA_ID=CAMNT_0001739515 /DNA_START=45 /DNA_END=1580 /DNA_ORIENTATION=+
MKGKKSMKGASKAKASKNETEEERRLRLEMEALKAEEERRVKEEMMRAKLKEWQLEEERFSRLNRNKIQNQWRKLMRMAKVESLRKDLEIMSQNHEREVDMKDAIIQMLDRDLDEAEEQYQMALRSHLQNVDTLIDLFNAKIRQLESEFEEELKALQDEFETERTYVVNKHKRDKKELQDVMELVETQHNDSEAEAKQEFESFCEEIKNKNLEDLNVLKLTLESQIEELERHFESAHQNYLAMTEQRTKEFKILSQRDTGSSITIDAQFKKVQRSQEGLANWKTKIASNVKECEERNRLLREEKEQISAHFQDMKQRMNKMRDEQAARLQDMSIKSRHCIQECNKQKKRAENILLLAELNRKLETEREKVIPFYPTPMDEDSSIPEDLAVDANALSSYAIDKDGKPVEEWNYLDTFFRRYNKVLLDKVCIEREKGRLGQENADLRSILRQYLDGISVNAEVLDDHNPLVVVNNRSGIQVAQPVPRQPVVPVVDANTVVNQVARMTGSGLRG